MGKLVSGIVFHSNGMMETLPPVVDPKCPRCVQATLAAPLAQSCRGRASCIGRPGLRGMSRISGERRHRPPKGRRLWTRNRSAFAG